MAVMLLVLPRAVAKTEYQLYLESPLDPRD